MGRLDGDLFGCAAPAGGGGGGGLTGGGEEKVAMPPPPMGERAAVEATRLGGVVGGRKACRSRGADKHTRKRRQERQKQSNGFMNQRQACRTAADGPTTATPTPRTRFNRLHPAKLYPPTASPSTSPAPPHRLHPSRLSAPSCRKPRSPRRPATEEPLHCRRHHRLHHHHLPPRRPRAPTAS